VEFKAALSKLEVLSGRLHYLLLVSLGLLISNIFLVWLVSWSFLHQKRTVIPMSVHAPFTISDYRVDASYLRQMALFFVAERLNLTPDNIKQAHEVILQYTDPKFYHEFFKVLNQEQQEVEKQKISSVFYPSEVIPDPSGLKVLIKGSLSRWVNSLALPVVKKSYLIKFTYSSGILKVLSFSELGENNVSY
jgi:conjugal transfer pilus assembly protein TraE